MPFVDQISSEQFISVLGVLLIIILIVHLVVSLYQKFKPKESTTDIAKELAKLTTRFDSLDQRCTKIETACVTCKEKYLEDLDKIYNEIKGVRSSVDTLTGRFEGMKEGH